MPFLGPISPWELGIIASGQRSRQDAQTSFALYLRLRAGLLSRKGDESCEPVTKNRLGAGEDRYAGAA